MKKLLFAFCLFLLGASCEKDNTVIKPPPEPEPQKPVLELKFVDYNPEFVYVNSELNIEDYNQFTVYNESVIETGEYYDGYPIMSLEASNKWTMPTSSIGLTIDWRFVCVACDTLYLIVDEGQLKITEKGPNIIYCHLNKYQYSVFLP